MAWETLCLTSARVKSKIVTTIPVFNGEAFIAQTLESVARQTLAPDRVVVVYSAVAIGVIPFGVLGVSAWLGVLFPYHPIPVRYRWEHRRRWWPMLGRWGTLVLLPYAVVPALTIVFLAPTLLIWGLTSPKGLTSKLPDNDLGLGIALACVIAIGAAYFGQRASLWLVARRRDRLVAYLADPTRG